jgi:hypothetical protein
MRSAQTPGHVHVSTLRLRLVSHHPAFFMVAAWNDGEPL